MGIGSYRLKPGAAPPLLLLPVILALVACGGRQPRSVSPVPSVGRSASDDCPANVDSRLRRLVTASDPEAAARELGLSYQGGKTRVEIVLRQGAEIPSAWLPDITATATADGKILVQADLAAMDLCSRASQPDVILIRPATGGYPDEP